ncbi:hypothetical protein ARTHRO8AJ_60171 [Arthrobacter sp. 8AJ]|nr:hypothetical protein ARTHRO8AJ_60171 [Arthrobacter sp. 8AJ]
MRGIAVAGGVGKLKLPVEVDVVDAGLPVHPVGVVAARPASNEPFCGIPVRRVIDRGHGPGEGFCNVDLAGGGELLAGGPPGRPVVDTARAGSREVDPGLNVAGGVLEPHMARNAVLGIGGQQRARFCVGQLQDRVSVLHFDIAGTGLDPVLCRSGMAVTEPVGSPKTGVEGVEFLIEHQLPRSRRAERTALLAGHNGGALDQGFTYRAIGGGFLGFGRFFRAGLLRRRRLGSGRVRPARSGRLFRTSATGGIRKRGPGVGTGHRRLLSGR